MTSLPTILLQLQPDLTHPLRALAGLDLVVSVFGGSFGASFLVEPLFATLTLPLHAFHDVDGAALGDLRRGACVGVFLVAGDGG